MATERMSQRQAAFRADFRTRIAPAYYGWAHVALIYALGGAAIWYCARQIAAPAWYEFLVIPVAFCISNAFEWWIHRYVMHRPVKGFMGIYKRHTLAHHQFFTHIEPTIDNTRDFRIVFFPPYALVAFMALSLPPAALLGLVGLPNAGWLLLITNVGLYLNYELFHYWCHVKDDRIVRVTVGPDSKDAKQEVFASGWIEGDQGYLGRPDDIILAKDGSILVADDWAGAIYRISYKK